MRSSVINFTRSDALFFLIQEMRYCLGRASDLLRGRTLRRKTSYFPRNMAAVLYCRPLFCVRRPQLRICTLLTRRPCDEINSYSPKSRHGDLTPRPNHPLTPAFVRRGNPFTSPPSHCASRRKRRRFVRRGISPDRSLRLPGRGSRWLRLCRKKGEQEKYLR
jgi:hypothetical protein